MTKKALTPIVLETVPNGYALTIKGFGYMYFTLEELLKGFMVHIGLKELDYMNNEGIESFIEAALKWKDNGKLVRELTKCKEKLERLEGNNQQLKKKLSKYVDDIDDLE